MTPVYIVDVTGKQAKHILKFVATIVMVFLRLHAGHSARWELRQSRWRQGEFVLCRGSGVVWVSRFYTEQICNSSCSSWLSQIKAKSVCGQQRLPGCQRWWTALVKAGFLGEEQQLRLVKVNLKVFGWNPVRDFSRKRGDMQLHLCVRAIERSI